MARRAGKAASRRARQQRRASARVAATRGRPPPVEDIAVEEGAVESREEPRRASAPVPPRHPPRAPTRRRVEPDGSRAGEYHYVERDLRNIGILTVILVGSSSPPGSSSAPSAGSADTIRRSSAAPWRYRAGTGSLRNSADVHRTLDGRNRNRG